MFDWLIWSIDLIDWLIISDALITFYNVWWYMMAMLEMLMSHVEDQDNTQNVIFYQLFKGYKSNPTGTTLFWTMSQHQSISFDWSVFLSDHTNLFMFNNIANTLKGYFDIVKSIQKSINCYQELSKLCNWKNGHLPKVEWNNISTLLKKSDF
jgi:hypothetical protein